MINLLPPKEKKELFVRKTRTLILVLGSIFLLSLIGLILILFSINTYLKSEVDYQEALLQSKKKQAIREEIKAIQKEIESYNKNLLEINSFYKEQLSLSKVLNQISEILPSGFYLTSFSYQNNKVVVSGFAPTRESLFQLREALKEKGFKEVHFPAFNWTKATDINFNFSFKINGI